MSWPLDVFWAAVARTETFRRQAKGEGPTPQDRATQAAKVARDRAKWGASAFW